MFYFYKSQDEKLNDKEKFDLESEFSEIALSRKNYC